MIYFITGLIMIALVITFFFSSAGGSLRSSRTPARPPSQTSVTSVSAASLVAATLTKAEISARLTRLASAPDPKNLKMGAMCYKVASPPRRAEYICPRCGTRTLYAEDSAKKTLDASFVQKDIIECRRRAKAIAGLGLALNLDESEFCSKCAPSVKNPELILVIHYGGREGDFRVRRISTDDMKLLEEFLEGKDRHAGDTDTETSMKSHLRRLKELLGTE